MSTMLIEKMRTMQDGRRQCRDMVYAAQEFEAAIKNAAANGVLQHLGLDDTKMSNLKINVSQIANLPIEYLVAPKAKPPEGLLRLTQPSRISFLTFGGKENYVKPTGQEFTFDYLIEENTVFTIIRCGLNHYVFESQCVEIVRRPTEKPKP